MSVNWQNLKLVLPNGGYTTDYTEWKQEIEPLLKQERSPEPSLKAEITFRLFSKKIPPCQYSSKNIQDSQVETLFYNRGYSIGRALATSRSPAITFKATLEKLTPASILKVCTAILLFGEAKNMKRIVQEELNSELYTSEEEGFKYLSDFIADNYQKKSETLQAAAAVLESAKQETGIEVEFVS
ncbi:MAG: hypothetical protein V4487_02310 [Chlamydiota bacterium]